MRFGSTGATKLATSVHALALLAAAAARVGDRTALVCFDDRIRASVAPGRGAAHAARVMQAAAASLASPGGPTRLEVALRALRTAARQRSVLLLLSDFLDPDLLAAEAVAAGELARLGRRHDVIAGCTFDPRERELAAAGGAIVADPERPGSRFLLRTSSRRARRRYALAASARRDAVAAALRRAGAELLWLDTRRSPLHALVAFLQARAGRRVRGAR
jgi:uncharacterized protein (DUF58 family)